MNEPDPDILVRDLVDGDLSDAELERALHRIADDAEARELLRFELRMTQDLAASSSTQPPANFAGRTMDAIAEEPAWAPDIAVIDKLSAWWQSATAPVTLHVRPLTTAVVTLLLAVGVWMAWPTGVPGPQDSTPVASTSPKSTQSSTQQASARSTHDGETVWIRFRYTDNAADSVAVAGDFSRWDPIPLSPHTVNGQTVWTGLVPVSRGEHEYQFVINGERWVTDPLAPMKRSDGFGAKNAVLKI